MEEKVLKEAVLFISVFLCVPKSSRLTLFHIATTPHFCYNLIYFIQ